MKEEVIRRIWGSAYLPDLERGKNSVSLLLSDGTPLKDSFRINSYPQLFTGQAPDPETKDGRALMEEIFLFGQHFLDSSPRPTPPRVFIFYIILFPFFSFFLEFFFFLNGIFFVVGNKDPSTTITKNWAC